MVLLQRKGKVSKDARVAASRPSLVIRTPVSVTIRIAGAGDFSLLADDDFTLTIPNSGERALWWMWLRQKALLALAANLLGRLAVFVRWGPQDDEGESALPNPHSHSNRSLWSRKAPGGRRSAGAAGVWSGYYWCCWPIATVCFGTARW
jgi:hypothetical protein